MHKLVFKDAWNVLVGVEAFVSFRKRFLVIILDVVNDSRHISYT